MRKGFNLKTPRLVFREVPMKDVDFEARQEVDLSAEVVDRDKRASDIVHETADFEGGKVGDCEAFEPWCGATLRELAQSLCGANHTDGRGGGDVDALGRNAEPIAFGGEAFEWIVEGVERGVEANAHCGLGFARKGAPRFAQHRGQLGTVGGIVEQDGAGERKIAFGAHHSVGTGQQVGDFSPTCTDCAAQTEKQEEAKAKLGHKVGWRVGKKEKKARHRGEARPENAEKCRRIRPSEAAGR